MLGLGLKIPKLRTSGLAAWLRAFIKRVREDGGTVEGKACVKADGEFLINNTRAGIIIEALGDYSKAQGGDGLVNKTCSEIAVNDLLFDPKPQTRFLFLSQDKNLELADYFCLNADVDALEGQFAVKGSVSNSYGSPTRGEVVLSLYNGTAPYTYKWSNGATTQNVANLAKGDYWVQATDANGNVANNKFTILGDADPAIVTQGLRMDSYFSANSLDFPALGSAEFNGTSDYVQLDTPFSHTTHTIAAWLYHPDVNSFDRLFDNRSSGSDSSAISVYIGSGNDVMNYSVCGTGLTQQSSAFLNEWYFFTGTYDGSTMRLYINGSLDNSTQKSATLNATQNARIGANAWLGANYWDGNLANVAIWNRALSSDEINSVMFKSVNALTSAESNGLQAWYSLDDIDGTNVPDSSGNGNNGTAY